jgi:hypothetical protein
MVDDTIGTRGKQGALRLDYLVRLKNGVEGIVAKALS